MTKYLRKCIRLLLEGRSSENNDERYLFLTLLIAVVFAGLVHVILIGLLIHAQMILMVFLTLGSLAMDSACICLIVKRRYTLCGLALSASVSCYTLLTVYFLGAGTYAIFYMLAILLLQVTIPYARRPVRGVVICLLFAMFCVVICADFLHTPAYHLGRMELPLALFNMGVGFLGTVAQLGLTNIIRSLITRYHERKLESYRNQAYTDPLTGLYNRRYAQFAFEKIARERAGNWCVAMLDIDDFKRVNDEHGHNMGDVVLRVISDTMRETLRKTDVLVRWGGEEFLLLLSDVDVRTATAILEKLLSTIGATQIISEGATVAVTVTIGVAALDAGVVEGSISRRVEMLYEGKRRGKNMVTAA